MNKILSTISRVSNSIFNTVSYASGLLNSLRRKNFTKMAEARGVSHDQVRRELKRAVNEKEAVRMTLQNEAEKKIKVTAGGGALILDFTVAIKEHAKKIDSVVRQYAGSKTAKGISMGLIAWTDLKELILPIDLITWKKGDRPKNQSLIELAISLAQRINVRTILADAFFATRHLFGCLQATGILVVTRFKSTISVSVEGFGKFQLRNHPAFRFDRNERCVIRTVEWHGFSLRIIALRLFNSKSGWNTIFLVTNASFEKACEYADFYKHRWKIEPLFRYVKQVCGLEDCQARNIKMQEAHFFACLYAYFSENINKPLVDKPKSKPRRDLVPMFCKYRKPAHARKRSIRYSPTIA